MSTTINLPLSSKRKPFFLDRDGSKTIARSNDETETLVIDWSDRLGTDTVSTSSWEYSGVSGASEANTTTTATTVLTGTSGYAKNTVVTAAGETLVETIYVVDSEGGGLGNDYGV